VSGPSCGSSCSQGSSGLRAARAGAGNLVPMRTVQASTTRTGRKPGLEMSDFSHLFHWKLAQMHERKHNTSDHYYVEHPGTKSRNKLADITNEKA